MWNTKELEALDPFHYSPIDVNGGVLAPPLPVDDYVNLPLTSVHDLPVACEYLKVEFRPR
jgi:hypothetical protein